ncbi:unnamed protein product [Colias eurytheme]|nr:unnamed protein product [Colias eurytheme]
MANKCNACGKFFASVDGAKCNKCCALYHKPCCSPDARSNAKWICKACKAKANKAAETVSAPEREADVFLDVEPPQQQGSPSLVREIKLLRSELSSFRLEMSRISTLVASFGTRLDGLEERVSQLESKPCCENLESIDLLKRQLNESQQENLLNDVEITGVSESSGENLLHVVITLAQKIGLSIEERDIVNVRRRGTRRQAETDGGTARARPIVVRLTRRHLRDELLHAARVRRGADTAGTGVGGEPRRFYINEHLTYANRNLFYIARERLGGEKNWRFIWTRGGNIYARKDSKSVKTTIKSQADIDRVFCL